MVVSNLGCLTPRRRVSSFPRPHFDAGAMLAAIESERCTLLHGVPTMFVAELEHADFAAFDLSSLRTGIMAGAPCPPELMQAGDRATWACREILIGYGQTEASPVTHLHAAPTTRSSGAPRPSAPTCPHQEVKVVDPATGATVPLGEPGEICFRGYHVMRGYFEHAGGDRARRSTQRGWLHSGDLGVMDEDGYVRDHRPPQGHDHPRRREHLPGGDRGLSVRAPQGGAGRGLRRPRRALGRGVWAPGSSSTHGETADRGGAPGSSSRTAWRTSRCPPLCASSTSSR